MAENQTMTEIEVNELILWMIKLHTEDIVIDEVEFLDLLQNSLSLNVMEKKRK